MASFWRAATGAGISEDLAGDVEFWFHPERAGWLTKQGEYIKTWRRRWFVLKQGRLFWFKDPNPSRASEPRGVILAAACLIVREADDVIKKRFAFQLSTAQDTMFFVADSEKEREAWINSIGRSIIQHSKSATEYEVVDYDSRSNR